MSVRARKSAIEIFDAATKLPKAERDAYLARTCGDDADLLAEVRSLLSHLEQAGDFLDQGPLGRSLLEPKTPAQDIGRLVGAVAGVLAPGARVGRYTIERIIGEGGMGVVYQAQQEHPRRSVALKVIRPSAATPAMVRRFTREAELLGRLQHPGIAQIFEAGTADLGGGVVQPFLAMEFVPGEPITDYARRQRLDTGERLALVARLCEAVAHAHQRGLIHRDLKPANILVDAHGQPKILDFGVARAIDASVPRVTMATEVGTLVGTLAYMSPEQISGDPAAVDTRSDIYGLGVILYELICGRRPHDTGDLTLFDAARHIREQEPTRPGIIRRELRGDIETITLKAMAKDRDRRYTSADALREDLLRYLAGKPILARQDSAVYVLRKTIRRHAGLVTGVAVAILGLAGFAVYATVQSGKERDARLKAEQEKTRADSTADRLAEELHVSNVARARWLMDNETFLAAEDVLWKEQLQRPDSAIATWALRDLYARWPVELAIPTGEFKGRAMDVSPDGRVLAAGGANGDVTLWSLKDGSRLGTVPSGGEQALGALFHPEGGALATIGTDGELRIWDIADPAAPSERARAHPSERQTFALAYSRDGRMLAAAGADGTVAVLDGLTAEGVRTLKGEGRSGRLNAVAFDDTGRWLAFGGDPGSVFVADLESPAGTMSARIRPGSTIQSLAFTHDGTRLLVSTYGVDDALWIFDAASGARLSKLQSTDGAVRSIDLTADDRYAAVIGHWYTTVWDLAQGRPAADIPVRPRGGHRVRLFQGLERMAATTSTGEVRVWSLRSAPHVTSIPAHTGSIGRASISADGSVALTSSSGEGAAAAWDVATWKEITRVRSSDEFTISFGLIAPDGASFALGSRQGAVRLLDTRDARLLAEFRDLRRQPLACVFTEDSSRLIGATEPGQVVVWDARGGRLERELRASGADVLSLAAAGGQRIALGLRGGVIQVWDAAAAAVVHELTLPEGRPAFALAYSPDRTRVAVGGFNGSVDILDAATGRQLQSFQAHAQALYRLHFSPDGAVLASASRDEFGKLWEVATGRFLARVEERSATASPATNVLFIPGSPTLLVTYGSGTLEARDTTYPDHCIAGNVEHQLIRHAAELGAGVDEPRVREWVKSLGGRGTGK